MFVRTLVVTDDLALPERLRAALPADAELLQPCSPAEIEDCLPREACDLVLVGADALSDMPKAVVARIRVAAPAAEVVALQRREAAEQRASLLAAGCLGVVPEELSAAGLSRALGAFVARRRESLVLRSRSRLEPTPDAALQTCRSRSMVDLLEAADRVAAADSPVLVLGETGSGKEWLARRIHGRGVRASGAFIAVNCAAVSATLWESEIFGHEKGAFTGADATRRGRFEMAHRGTLFLDEIGEMPQREQAKLLRAVESGEVQRIGSEHPLAVDARIVSATNRDIEADSAAGRFRRDLLYRLAVVTLHLPPLRERPEDLEPLAQLHLERACQRLGRPPATFTADGLAMLAAYTWPGNVRELANVVERAVLLAATDELGAEELALPVVGKQIPGRRGSGLAPTAVPDLDRPLRDVVDEQTRRTERAYLHAQLLRSHGVLATVAQRSGLPARSLHRKMRELALRKEDYRPDGDG